MYHDVVDVGDADASGFPGPWAARYKLDTTQFARHLGAIREAIGEQPVDLTDHEQDWAGRRPLFLTFLFTSEPTSQTWMVGGCLVLGRYFIQNDTPPETAAAFAAGRPLPRFLQAVRWNLSRLVKRSTGSVYLRLGFYCRTHL